MVLGVEIGLGAVLGLELGFGFGFGPGLGLDERVADSVGLGADGEGGEPTAHARGRRLWRRHGGTR